jgi:hypothetical protein
MDGVEALQYILNNDIEGSIVECGVDKGHFEYIWINELIRQGKERDIYMYDTFKGLTKPTKYDYTTPYSPHYIMNSNEVFDYWSKHIIDDQTNNWCFTPLHEVQTRLSSTGYPESRLHYIVGDVLETLEQFVPEKIALLRLDTDWYESSKIELEKMYDKVVDGGIIIFDDYYHWDGQRRATDDYFRKINKNYIIKSLNNGKTGSIIKNRDLID